MQGNASGAQGSRAAAAARVLRLVRRFGTDLALLVTAILMLTTDATVLFFHLIFFWLALGAFHWQFKAFVPRAIFWVTVASTEVLLAVIAGTTQAEELIELPLLTAILVLIFIIARRRAEAQAQLLEHRAMHDPLTELPNRDLFMERLRHAVVLAERRTGLVAVLHLDVDHLKTINDSLGPRVGDKLLVALAGRIQECLRPGDTLARLGGDEFAILLEEVSGVNVAARVAERVREKLGVPFDLGEHETFATACVGISTGSRGLEHPEDLLRDAETATSRAKYKGTAQHEFFEERTSIRVRERLKLENDLRLAVERGQFTVHYQPKVNLRTDRIVGAEALVRWEHPERGLVPPNDFIPLAEETGLVVPIGEWVLGEACRQAKAWQEMFASAPPLRISVNLSAKQFGDPELARTIIQTAEEAGLEPGNLQVELTESVLMSDSELALQTLKKLGEAGVWSAIDDFGKGYSSLSYLKNFPVDVLKVDRSFISRMNESAEDAAVVKLILDLAHTLGLRVTAEGIETAEQAEWLREMGCDLGQGFFFYKPLPGPAATNLLGKGTFSNDQQERFRR